MNLKLHLKFMDVIKLLLGGSVLVLDPFNLSIYRVEKGEDTYICKG